MFFGLLACEAKNMSAPASPRVESSTRVPGFIEVLYRYDAQGRLISAIGIEERVPSTEPRLLFSYRDGLDDPVKLTLETKVIDTGPVPKKTKTDRFEIALEYDDRGQLRLPKLSPERREQLEWHLELALPTIQSGDEAWASVVKALLGPAP